MKFEADKDTVTKIGMVLVMYFLCSLVYKLFTYEKDIELRLALVQEQQKELKQEERKMRQGR